MSAGRYSSRDTTPQVGMQGRDAVAGQRRAQTGRPTVRSGGEASPGGIVTADLGRRCRPAGKRVNRAAQRGRQRWGLLRQGRGSGSCPMPCGSASRGGVERSKARGVAGQTASERRGSVLSPWQKRRSSER